MYNTIWFGKEYHLSPNKKGNLTLHAGVGPKCKRVHYNSRGQKL